MSPHANKSPKKNGNTDSSKGQQKTKSSFVDKKPYSAVQRQIQELADNSPKSEQLRSIQKMADSSTQSSFSYGKKAPVQAKIMSLSTFKEITDLGESRKSIKLIDTAIKNYETFLKAPVDVSDFDTSQERKLVLLRLIEQAASNYILEKETNDSDNKRIEPVKYFKQDVLLEIDQAEGNFRSDFDIMDKIVNKPDKDSTRNLMLQIAVAPRARQIIETYLSYAPDPQKIALTEDLFTQGKLTKLLDQAFISGPGLELAGIFPKGNALTDDQKKIMKLFVNQSANLDTVKELTAIRFGLDPAKIKGLEAGKPDNSDGTIQQEVDWDLEGLKRAYGVMNELPNGHAANNASFEFLKRFKGSGGWYGDGNTVSLAYDDIKDNKKSKRTVSDWWDDKGLDVFTGKNYFDASVRHEVGHAVDKQKGFSQVYCATPDGGSWINYKSYRAMVQDYFVASNSIMGNHDACNHHVEDEIAKLITGAGTTKNIKAAVTRMMRERSEDLRLDFDPQIVKNDSIFENLHKSKLKEPWSSSGGPVVGGRTFVYSNDSKIFSYDAAARANQVSNYQFRAPAEWFAEAYSAFYAPDESPLGHGSALQGRDQTTYDYMILQVHKAL